MANNTIKTYSIEIEAITSKANAQIEALENELNKLGDGKSNAKLQARIDALAEMINGLKGEVKSSAQSINAELEKINTGQLTNDFKNMQKSIEQSISGLQQDLVKLEEAMDFLKTGDFSKFTDGISKSFSELSDNISRVLSDFKDVSETVRNIKMGTINVSGFQQSEKSIKKSTENIDVLLKEFQDSLKEFKKVNNENEIGGFLSGMADTDEATARKYPNIISRVLNAAKKLKDIDGVDVYSILTQNGTSENDLRKLRSSVNKTIDDVYGEISEKVKKDPTEVRFKYVIEDPNNAAISSIVNKIKTDVIDKVQNKLDSTPIRIPIGYTYDKSIAKDQSELDAMEGKDTDKVLFKHINLEVKSDTSKLVKGVNSQIEEINKQLQTSGKKIEVEVIGKVNESTIEQSSKEIEEEIQHQQYHNRSVSLNGGSVSIDLNSGIATESTLADIRSILESWNTSGIPGTQSEEFKQSLQINKEVESAMYDFEQYFKIRKRGNTVVKSVEDQARTTESLRASLILTQEVRDEVKALKRSKKLKSGDISPLKQSKYFNDFVEVNGVKYSKYGGGATLEDWQKELTKMFNDDTLFSKSIETIKKDSDGNEIKDASGEVVKDVVKIKGYFDKVIDRTKKSEKHIRESLSLNGVEYKKDENGKYTDQILFRQGTITGVDDVYDVVKNKTEFIKDNAIEELKQRKLITEDLIEQRRIMQEIVLLSDKVDNASITEPERARLEQLKAELDDRTKKPIDKQAHQEIVSRISELEQKNIQEGLTSKDRQELESLNAELQKSFVSVSDDMVAYSKSQLKIVSDGQSKIDKMIGYSQKKESKIIKNARANMSQVSIDNFAPVKNDSHYERNEQRIAELQAENSRLGKLLRQVKDPQTGKYKNDYSLMTAAEEERFVKNEREIKNLRAVNLLYKQQQEIQSDLIEGDKERQKHAVKITDLHVPKAEKKAYEQMLGDKPSHMSDQKYIQTMTDEQLSDAQSAVTRVQAAISEMTNKSDEEITAAAKKLIQQDIKKLKAELKEAIKIYEAHEKDGADAKTLKNDQYNINRISDSLLRLDNPKHEQSSRLQEQLLLINQIDSQKAKIAAEIQEKKKGGLTKEIAKEIRIRENQLRDLADQRAAAEQKIVKIRSTALGITEQEYEKFKAQDTNFDSDYSVDNLYESRLEYYKQGIADIGKASVDTVNKFGQMIESEIQVREERRKTSAETQALAEKEAKAKQKSQNVSYGTKIRKINKELNPQIAQGEDELAIAQERYSAEQANLSQAQQAKEKAKKGLEKYIQLNLFQQELDSIEELRIFRQENIDKIKASLEEDKTHAKNLLNKINDQNISGSRQKELQEIINQVTESVNGDITHTTTFDDELNKYNLTDSDKEGIRLLRLLNGTNERIEKSNIQLSELEAKHANKIEEENKAISAILSKRDSFLKKHQSKKIKSLSVDEMNAKQNELLSNVNASTSIDDLVQNGYKYLQNGGDYTKLPDEFVSALKKYIAQQNEAIEKTFAEAKDAYNKASDEYKQKKEFVNQLQTEKNRRKTEASNYEDTKKSDAELRESFDKTKKKSNISKGMNEDQRFASYKVDNQLKEITKLSEDLEKAKKHPEKYAEEIKELSSNLEKAHSKLFDFRQEAKNLGLKISDTTGRMYLDDSVKDVKIGKKDYYTGLGEVSTGSYLSTEEQRAISRAITEDVLGLERSEQKVTDQTNETNAARSKGSKYLEGMNEQQQEAAKELQKSNSQLQYQEKLIKQNKQNSKRMNEEELAQLREKVKLDQERALAVGGLSINQFGYAELDGTAPTASSTTAAAETIGNVEVTSIQNTSGLALEATLQKIYQLLSSGKISHISTDSVDAQSNQKVNKAETSIDSINNGIDYTKKSVDELVSEYKRAERYVNGKTSKGKEYSQATKDKWSSIQQAVSSELSNRNYSFVDGQWVEQLTEVESKAETVANSVSQEFHETSQNISHDIDKIVEKIEESSREAEIIKQKAAENGLTGALDIAKITSRNKKDDSESVSYRVSDTFGNVLAMKEQDGLLQVSRFKETLSSEAKELKAFMNQIDQTVNNSAIQDIYNFMPELASQDEAQKIYQLREAYDQLNQTLEAFNTGTKTDFSSDELIKLNEQINIIEGIKKSFSGEAINLGKISPEEAKDLQNTLMGLAQSTEDAALRNVQFGKANREMTYQIKTSDGMLNTYRITVDKTGQAFKELVKSEKYLNPLQKGLSAVSKKFGEVWHYMVASTSIYEVFNFVRQGVTIVREFDAAMTELYKVAQDSTEALEAFGKEAYNIAAAIGSTGVAIINSAADWEKLGYSIDEASELAKNSALYANVGDMDIDTATEHMVSTLKAFNVEAKDSISLVDKFNHIGNNYAITSAGIGEALERSAASLVAAGNDIDQSIALITAGNIISQDPESVGNAIKVLSLRIRGSKTELEEMGEETDGLASSTSKLRQEIQSLTGVDIMLDENTYKSTYDIIVELSKVWDKLDDVSQANVLEKLAGKTRSSVVAGLLQQGETLEKVYTDSIESAGSAEKENERFMESIQGHMNELTNQWQAMWTNALTRDLINFFIDAGTAALKFVDTIGLIPTVAAAATAAFAIKNQIKGSGGRAKKSVLIICHRAS